MPTAPRLRWAPESRIRLVSSLAALAMAAPLAAQRSVVITGSVRNEITGDAVAQVSIAHQAVFLAQTDVEGHFRLPGLSVSGDEAILTFRRIGFAPHAETVPLDGRDSIDLTITMRPVPTVLEEIEVDGRTITIRNPDLIGFYNRREVGVGRYLTQTEIDRAKSFELSGYLRRLRPTSQRECAFGATMAVYLDGMRVPDFATLNEIIAPIEVGGIEFYPEEHKHQLPPEFITPGATCGTMLVWTRVPRGNSTVALGVHVSSAWGSPAGRHTYLGARIRFPLRDPPSSLAFLVSVDGTSGSVSDDAWRAFLTPVLRPTGVGAPWYVGAGVAVVRPPAGASVEPHPAAVSGLEARIGSMRPFVEARVFRVSDPVVTIVTGFALAIGAAP